MPDSEQRAPAPLWQQLSSGSVPETLTQPTARPHILLILDGFPRSLGGGERVVLRLAALLPSYGFRVSILTFFLDPASSFQPSQSPCPLFLLSLGKTYGWRGWRGALALRRYIREEKVGLVQTFFESSDLWAGMVVRLLTPAKLIWSRRDMGILRGGKHALAYRLLRRLPHAVHAVSDGVRAHAVAVDRIPTQRCFTVYNGLDLEAFQAPHRDDRSHLEIVLTIGNIRRIKGHDILVKAAALVRDKVPDVRFLLAGEVLEEGFFQELQQAVSSHGLQSTFCFLGGIKDLPAQLQAADLFVLPSRSEGFSNSLIEAMACALPVIATDVGGNGEAIQDGVTGVVVRSENPQALAQAIVKLLGSPEQRQRMGQAGRQRVKTYFSVDAMLRQLTERYRDLLRES